jgi:cytochrome c biogenesis protein CcdA
MLSPEGRREMAELIIIMSIILAFAGFLTIMYGFGMLTVYVVSFTVDHLENILRYFRRIRK